MVVDSDSVIPMILRVEAVNMDNVLDDTDQISIRRGAGLLLRQAPKEIAVEFKEFLKPISLGASIGIFLFDANKKNADELTQKICAYLNKHEHYKHITFVVATEPMCDNDYRGAINRLMTRIRWQQLQQPSLALPVVENEWSQPCGQDHLRPAVKDNPVRGKPASRSSSARFRYGREQRDEFYQSELQDYCAKLQFTHDLGHLTEGGNFGNLNGKMALFYGDGNDFSKIQQDACKTYEEQQDFDTTVQHYHRQFLKKLIDSADNDLAFKTTVDPKTGTATTTKGWLRLETLLWGGDEFLLVVPAWKGFEVMQLFLQESKDWVFKKKGGGECSLTYACGLVFCYHKTPMVRVRHLAQELAGRVKAHRRDQRGWDYLVLESIDYASQSLDAYFKQRYGQLAEQRTLPGIPTLSGDLVTDLEKLPRRQLYAVVKELVADMNHGRHYTRLEKLVGGKEKMEQIKEDLKALFPADNKTDNESAEKWCWLHWLELYDYLYPTSSDESTS